MRAIFFAFYNFGRMRESLKGQTPPMAAGLVEKASTIGEMLEQAAEVWLHSVRCPPAIRNTIPPMGLQYAVFLR
jgi:hypothetical protein